MSALRFAMLTTFYPPYNFGGDGIGVQRLSRALVARGHHVTVIHDADAYNMLHRGPEPSAAPGDDGIEVHRLRSRAGSLSALLTQQTGRPIVHGRAISDILARGRFDVVQFNNVSLVGGPGILGYGGDAVRLYEAHEHWLVCPTHVLWRHNREACPARECLRCTLRHRRPPQYWRYSGYLERELRHVDTFIAKSDFSREKHREFGFPRDMEVVPYFLPDGTGEPGGGGSTPHDRPYFLFVGRLEKIKGLDDVIPVFAANRDADLLIAGTGEHEPVLRRLAADSPAVRFLGRLPPDELGRYYRHALALIVPSICFETFGIILIEAFRTGTPVIARRIGPFPEIVEACGGGLLFEDQAGLVDAMRRIRHEPGLRERLARAGRSGFERRWSEQAVLPKYLDVVRRAAHERGHARVTQALARELVS